jgi:hypothetical protein
LEGAGKGKVCGERHEVVAAAYDDSGDWGPGGVVMGVLVDSKEGAEDVGGERTACMECD